MDVGIKTLGSTSDGVAYKNPKPLARTLRKLHRVDKAIARSRRRHPGPSQRRERCYAKRAKLHERVANIRQNSHRQVTSAIAKTSGTVVVESLNVSGLTHNRKLARALSDASSGALGF